MQLGAAATLLLFDFDVSLQSLLALTPNIVLIFRSIAWFGTMVFLFAVPVYVQKILIRQCDGKDKLLSSEEAL